MTVSESHAGSPATPSAGSGEAPGQHARAGRGPGSTAEPGAALASTALGEAASRALPLVQERRGTELRDTKGVARRLTMAAVDLFATRGFDEVTVTDIAEAAGVNRRTFFRYFPSKETVMLDIWDQTNAALLERIADVPGQDSFAVLGSAVVTWSEDYEDLMVGLSEVTEQSRALSSVTMLHSAEWEERISVALKKRFGVIDPVVADVSAVIAMGCMRIGRKRMLASGDSYAAEVARVFAALGRARDA